jgi:hypothetical protein
MREKQVINDVCNNASEWLEMSEDPAALVVGILANKVVDLKNYIEFLEKRLKNEELRNRKC